MPVESDADLPDVIFYFSFVCELERHTIDWLNCKISKYFTGQKDIRRPRIDQCVSSDESVA